jgi:hypothetical protein
VISDNVHGKISFGTDPKVWDYTRHGMENSDIAE